MTEVFRSEAHAAHFNCICQALLAGFLLAFALFSFTFWTISDVSNGWYTLVSLAAAVWSATKADRNYRIVKRYIQYPPNCHIESKENVNG